MRNKKKLLLIMLFCGIFGVVFCIFKSITTIHDKKDIKIIGIIPDYDIEVKKQKKYQKYFNYHILRDRYVDSFKKICKNIAFIILPIEKTNDDKALSLVNGIIVSGGDDINGKFFNQKTSDKVKDLEPDRRTQFVLYAVKYAIKNNKSLLGICNGMQAINIANGGDLIQDIPSYMKENSQQHAFDNFFESRHEVKISDNTWLKNIIKKDKILVNSNHHQAVGKIGKNLIVSAIARDGIIEAIECNNCKKPIIGVQWHPEFLMTKYDKKIIKTFCESL